MVMNNNSCKSSRRASLAVASTHPLEHQHELAVHAGSSAFYYTPQQGIAQAAAVTSRGYFLGIAQSPPTTPLVANNNNNSPSSNCPPKNRRKAVLIVDAKTSEILIASDSICSLFKLKDRSLIGKKLPEVFPSDQQPVYRKNSVDSKCLFWEDGSVRKGPLVLESNALFDENQQLKPVYGKPVDVLDANGNRQTICLWSYPLSTSAACLGSKRKTSAIIRSPSAYLPSENRNLVVQFPKTSPNRQTEYCPECSSPFESNKLNNALPPPQRSKSTCASYSPFLKVLHEDHREEHHPSSQTNSENHSSNELGCLQLRGGSTTESNNNQFGEDMVESRVYRDTPTANGNQQLEEPTAQPNQTKNGFKSATLGNLIEVCRGLRPSPQTEEPSEEVKKRRWLITMEPINALQMNCILGAKGRVFRSDDSLANILGYSSVNLLFGTEINRLIPQLKVGVEWDSKIQMCCGCTTKRNGVPLSVVLHSDCDHNSGLANSFDLEIRSLSSINGVITITDSGLLYSYNTNFLHELAGYEFNSVEERPELDIRELIPDFYTYFEQTQRANEDKYFSCEELRARLNEQDDSSSSTATANSSSACSLSSSNSSTNNLPKTASNGHFRVAANKEEIVPGIYLGLVLHSDGARIPVKIEVTPVEIPSNPKLFNVCVGYDRNNDYGFNQSENNKEEDDQSLEHSTSGKSLGAPGLSKASRFPNISYCASSQLLEEEAHPKFSLGGNFGSLRECDSDSAVDFIALKAEEQLHSSSSEVKLQEPIQDRGLLEDENNDAVKGEYSKYYETFQLIGNGAFGSVKLAASKESGLLTVTKFVCKSKVLPESWVQSARRGNRMIPIEVHLLENLNHPNIVKVMDVFENDKYYQLVMEKLGCGMDLFEFIENQHHKLEESLSSYIFRQIVSAVDYLHENHICHRDLKDENVIIDQNFCCKLIDFGSAAFFGDNIVFSTFCGTLEYCSPEVLTGNKYLGPELEMWSLGILLYTLVFFQNPFKNAQEIVHAEIELPWEISEGLFQVLSWLLLPDPKRRATVGEIKRHWWVTQRVDPKQYSFRELLKTCERAQVSPPLYINDLESHLKNASSCGNLVSISALNENESSSVSAR